MYIRKEQVKPGWVNDLNQQGFFDLNPAKKELQQELQQFCQNKSTEQRPNCLEAEGMEKQHWYCICIMTS